MKIAVGGFQHETNTFAPMKADWEAFVQADSWPGMQIGAPLLSACEGTNVPVAGFVAEAAARGATFEPLSWCSATPSGPVTKDAYERFTDMLLSQLQKVTSDTDAVYLDLHGAMVTEHLEDGEGTLLQRVRDIVGPDIWIVASLDLHANVTSAMMAAADFLTAYRTYPHVDMAETGRRTAVALDALGKGNVRLAKAFRKLDFLIPLTGSCTLVEPGASLYAGIAALDNKTHEHGAVFGASFATGFAPADIFECGPSVLVYAENQQTADAVADALVKGVGQQEEAFAGGVWAPDAAVAYAIAKKRTAGPIVMADTQDNPGAGGNGDTVGLLKALVAAEGARVALGVLYDPEVAAAAHAAGKGATIDISLGAKTGGAPGETPLTGTFEVLALSAGEFIASGPYYDGATLSLGPSALLKYDGIEIVVGSKKVQCADRAMFEHLGCDPMVQDIIAVKSSVHFRADFNSIASEILVVASPGPNPADHRELDYQHLRPGVRLMPGEPDMS
ncbi:MAG: microcystin degradation protein MlrC [Rhodobiaceae bacterium]|nr:MAG: microcystin degradation protein MlrC [Rhodobiaceae bacterium]